MSSVHPTNRIAAQPRQLTPAQHPTEPIPAADLTERYLAILAGGRSRESMHQRLAELTCQMINARSVQWIPDARAEPAGATATRDLNLGEANGHCDVAIADEELRSAYEQAQNQSQPVVQASQTVGQGTNIAIRVAGHGVLLCRLVAQPSRLPSFVALLKLAAGYFVTASAHVRQAQGLAFAADVQGRLRLIETLFQPGTIEQCLQQWCVHVAALAGASSTMLCLADRRGRATRLVAQSGTEQVDSKGETARLANQLASQLIIAGAELGEPISNQTIIKSRPATALSAHLGTAQVQALPIVAASGQTCGAVILAGDLGDVDRLNRTRQAVAESAAALLYRYRPTPSTSAVEPAGRSRWQRPIAALLSVAALIGLMWLPVPYHVRCPLTLAPETRRVVSAPFDGILIDADVSAGDVVAVGERLGRLDAQPLRLELSRIATEQVRLRKQQEIHVAQGEIAQAQLADLRLQELAATADLLRSRIEQAVITSPLAGVVISQDLEDVEHSSVALGQPLFEVAPLEVLHAEIEVPDYHAQHVSVGQPTSVWIDDGTGLRRQGELSRLAPRAEVLGDRNIIRCELLLSNDDHTLRPGMEGRAAIDVGQQRLGWVLFNRLWDRVRVYVGV